MTLGVPDSVGEISRPELVDYHSHTGPVSVHDRVEPYTHIETLLIPTYQVKTFKGPGVVGPKRRQTIRRDRNSP